MKSPRRVKLDNPLSTVQWTPKIVFKANMFRMSGVHIVSPPSPNL